MMKPINSLIKKVCGIVLLIMTLVAASCSSEDEPQTAQRTNGLEDEPQAAQGLEQDKDGMIMLHRDLKVKANTNYTMEEFEQEFFNHDTWEETTISEYKDGKWSANFLVEEGKDGWFYQQCYEFNSDGTANEYYWPSYTHNTDTIRYTKINYSIDPVHKSLKFIRKFKSDNEQYEEFTQTFKIMAVDKGRIVLDQISENEGLRRSIEPHDRIKGQKVEIKYW